MGTPGNDVWKGVEEFPEYKSAFPKWRKKDLSTIVKQLDPVGIDLLEKFLIYDPAQRISARKALQHAYFLDFDASSLPETPEDA